MAELLLLGVVLDVDEGGAVPDGFGAIIRSGDGLSIVVGKVAPVYGVSSSCIGGSVTGTSGGGDSA